MQRFVLPFLVVTLFSLSACGGTTALPNYSGPQYPETAQVDVLFQAGQAEPSCRVFAELFAFFPADVSAQTIQAVLMDEAKVRGAHMLLIGQSRESGKDEGMYLMYLGPPREYAMDRGWDDWRAGYDIWKKQLGWIGLGHGEWGREDVVYPVPLAVQAAMLRCR
ncbi:MAG: hypothetical protein Q4G66_11985 [bacterium]|nr:hypothetical protein [bacterium]